MKYQVTVVVIETIVAVFYDKMSRRFFNLCLNLLKSLSIKESS